MAINARLKPPARFPLSSCSSLVSLYIITHAPCQRPSLAKPAISAASPTKATNVTDGLWDMEAELHDSKAHDMPSFRHQGVRLAGDPIHHMWLQGDDSTASWWWHRH